MEHTLQQSLYTKFTRHLLKKSLRSALCAGALLLGAHTSAQADPADALAGSWSGSGHVIMGGGNHERAHCRVHYIMRSSGTYEATGTCATESGSVSQTAVVRKSGANTYSGTFYNSEYDVRGTVYIVLHGNSHTLHLKADNGSAEIHLSR